MYKLGIVDDEPRILKGLSNYYPWEDLGFSIVLQASNGKEVLGYLERGNPIDVLLCDISMPEMDGIQLAQIISEQYSSILVIFLSGYADFSYAQKAVKFNVFEYLLKPVKYNELVSLFIKVRLHLSKETNGMMNETTYYDSIIVRIHQYVEENLETVTWKRVANHIRLSSNYLSYIYKKHTGKNFSDYLLATKMSHAKAYLLETDMKTYEIAEKLGYSDPKNFTRAFRSYFNKSPRDYRKSLPNKDDDL